MRMALAIMVLYACSLGALLPWTLKGLWVSPDEASVAAFARAYAETGEFVIEEPMNDEVFGLLGPRSTVAFGERLVPGGFLGMPWMTSWSVWLFDGAAFPYALPVIVCALLGVVSLGVLVFELTKEKVWAISAAALLAIHPAWWLYATRPLMPNVPFVGLLLFAAALFVSSAKRSWLAGVAGLVFGLACLIRPVELPWLLLLTTLSLFVLRSRLTFERVLAAIIGALIMAGAGLALNAATYGGPFVTGYTLEVPQYPDTQSSVAFEAPADQYPPFLGFLAPLFPFGIHERALLRHGWQYGVLLSWWMSVPMLAGLALYVAHGRTRSWKLLLAAAFVTLWLITFYGSWTFFDNPDPNLITLGNSYARYFLPIFVFGAVFGGYALFLLDRKSRFLSAGVGVLLLIASLHQVMTGPDGWQHLWELTPVVEAKRDLLLAETSPDDILIIDRSDKYLPYGSRHLLVPLRDPATYAVLPKLLDTHRVWYFGITMPPEDLAYFEATVLAETGRTMTPKTTIADETLYLFE